MTIMGSELLSFFCLFVFYFLRNSQVSDGGLSFFSTFKEVHHTKHKLMVQFYDDSGSTVSHKR